MLRKNKKNGVRKILLKGVFWRILFIEAVLLIYSLFYKWFTENADFHELFWYAIRIIILVGIIIIFMMISLKKFLTDKIIIPLESLAAANKQIQKDYSKIEKIELPPDSPDEIKTIITSRAAMLQQIIRVSEERLHLVNFIKETFGRYLSKKVVEEILSSPGGHKLGGTRKQVTVLISDLRGFTGLSETRDPEDMVQLLNSYLEKMSKIILKYDGIIDEIIGDAILAVFGAPKSHGNDPERAIACAIEMQNCLEVLNKEILKSGYPCLEMGIGINTGNVIVGNIGSEVRMKYGIVGDAVNRASRIESNSIGGQILMGESTYNQIKSKSQIVVMPAQHIMMKGMKKPLVFYSVTAIKTADYKICLTATSQPHTRLAIKLGFQCWTIQDKKVNPLPFLGETITIDEGNIYAITSIPIALFTDIKLKFDFCIDAHCFDDIYAKATSTGMEEDKEYTRFSITAIDAKDQKIIKKWIEEASA
ncbi:MAG: adenylate/guanylate cyclase domain-containing protein [Desulfobacteraceae bacterium]|nr:adenylate/guanylate cyclase domain-containing protein [Desulfobacteraceae bacterium]